MVNGSYFKVTSDFKLLLPASPMELMAARRVCLVSALVVPERAAAPRHLALESQLSSGFSKSDTKNDPSKASMTLLIRKLQTRDSPI